LNTILNTQARPTGIPNLYFYDVSYDRFSYISKKVLVDYNNVLLGYVFVIANPKRFKNELYPELFGRGQSNSIESSSMYAFATYNNWKLISSHNDYPFSTIIKKEDFPRQEFFERKNGNYNELWYRSGPDRMVVIAKENNLSIESITLFSYLFCSFLLLTFIFWTVNVFLTARFNLEKIRTYWHLSIRNQIHGTIIFISVLSFFVIGIATILFFISRYENNNREKLSRTIRIMENEVKNSISAGWTMTDSLKMDSEDGKDIAYTINRISQIHGADVNLYDLKGNLQVSSLALPYIKGIISTIMDPVAYYHLNNKNEIQYFQKERIGKLNYVSNYIPVIDDAGTKYAYLNIPYFTSQTRLRDEISNFLVTIINLNAFIFLVAGIVALFITNRITNTFSLIGDKMKQVNLGQRNEAITWTRRDEIGELVVEYNKMVSKLDASAEALARNEREGAWREMAKQIAHEIKNPLTPMKLSMQYLQKSIEQNAPNVKELSANVAKTLVEQIDHLSHIASEFSQFANIENANPERVKVNDVLQNVLHLYSANDMLLMNINLLKSDIFIYADKSHLNRIFTNLVQNALQSADADQKVKITIKEKMLDDHVLISVEDNGTGIDEKIQPKIFTPNFTTKTSGTGLGLAMSKRMTEQAGGEIWFDTKPGTGSIFYVKFPVMKQA
jgi:signal transduction histidine kinase